MKKIIVFIWKSIEKITYFILVKIFHLHISEEKMESIYQFIKFGIVGSSNTIIHYFIYLLCSLSGIDYILSNFLAFTISVVNSFYWNNRFVFKEKETEQRFWLFVFAKTYISYALTGLGLNSLLLYIEVSIWGLNELVVPIFNLILTIPLNFVINKFWAYRSKNL